MFIRQINDWALGEVEGLLRRLQRHLISGGVEDVIVWQLGKGGYLFYQIFLLLSRLLSEWFPHKLGVESLGADESCLLCLGSSLGKKF